MSWIGGKKSSRDIIIPRFPLWYEKYIEVFGGGGWILFGKPPNNDFEIFNDFNSNISNLYTCVRDRSSELIERLRYVLNCREDFDRIKHIISEKADIGDVNRAAEFYQLIRYSYASGCDSFGGKPHSMWGNFPLIEQAYNSYDETFEFIGFGEILNSAPVIADGAYFTEQEAITKRNYKMTYLGEQSGTDYIVTNGHMPTVSGFPPTDFFDETLYDPEIKNALWNRVRNRSVLKNMSSTETAHYKYVGIDVEGWEEVPNGTYIREFTWDDPEFYTERMTVKNRGLNWSFRNSSCMVVINGIKKSANVFYVYRDNTEYQYGFGGFTYYSDDYDQY